MRQVINNLLYATETAQVITQANVLPTAIEIAEKIGHKVTSETGFHTAYLVTLYKTAKGNYFRHIHSPSSDNWLSSDDRIGAKMWLERHGKIDELLAEFGDEIETA